MRLFLFLTFLCIGNVLYAQVDYSLMENRVEYSDSNKFQLHIYNHNYNRNYEYFNKFADGITYFGSILQPEIIFNAQKDISLHLGFFARMDYGRSSLYQTQASFRINYHPGNWQIIAGRLDGNINHRLPEPIYNYDRIITDHMEFGNQFIYTREDLFFDAWLNWENMIYKISPDQESLSGGFHIEKKIIRKNRHKVMVPISFLAYHKGGQIDTLNVPLQTLLNTSIGLNYEFHYSEKKDHFIWLSADAMSYNDFSNTKVNPNASGGYGLMFNAGWKFGFTSLSATYWKAKDYMAVHGAPAYQSKSDQINNVNYYQKNRNVLFIRLISDYNITKEFSISARLEPYLDLDNTNFEFSNSLFFNYRKTFGL